jgi:methyl-accepting chemotaxis protein
VGTCVHQTAKRLKLLGERVQELGTLAAQLEDHSKQLNLLALNASLRVAAARPGDSASTTAFEVDHLAKRGARMAKQLSTLSERLAADANETSAAMERAIDEMVSSLEPTVSTLTRADVGVLRPIEPAADPQPPAPELVSTGSAVTT